MSILGDALLAAAAGAARQYGADRERERQYDEAAAAARAKEAYERRMRAFGASLEAPKYQTFDTVQDGQSGKSKAGSKPAHAQ